MAAYVYGCREARDTSCGNREFRSSFPYINNKHRCFFTTRKDCTCACKCLCFKRPHFNLCLAEDRKSIVNNTTSEPGSGNERFVFFSMAYVNKIKHNFRRWEWYEFVEMLFDSCTPFFFVISWHYCFKKI